MSSVKGSNKKEDDERGRIDLSMSKVGLVRKLSEKFNTYMWSESRLYPYIVFVL